MSRNTSLSNTGNSFGSVTRTFHWLTALLILTAIPLGLIANDMAYDTAEALARKAQMFSYHKTLGVAAFAVALLRLLWALTQRHPAPLHPGRRLETMLAGAVHWLLYVSLLAVPLSGWVGHAATSGFAPILWPLGQDMPLVPKSEAVAQIAGALHWVFTKLLIVSILLHIAGALKHHLIDRDATLHRMVSGVAAGRSAGRAAKSTSRYPAFAALIIYAAGSALALSLPAPDARSGQTAAAAPVPAIVEGGNWQVRDGTLSISTRQFGSDIQGSFAIWSAEITFDANAPDANKGQVEVRIDTTSLSLGSVTAQAQGPGFLDTAKFDTATFNARIRKTNAGYSADGALTLHGVEVPLSLPFALTIDQDIATMSAAIALDRRDFGIGLTYQDETTIGFETRVRIDLTAKRR